jgi:hypothetical protein
MATDAQSRAFLDRFGYVVARGLLAQDIGWIREEFERLGTTRARLAGDARRSCAVIDRSDPLFALVEHPRVRAFVDGLLGLGTQTIGADASIFSGPTSWHRDGPHADGEYYALSIYLDPLGRGSGCLRVLPGSHEHDLAQYWNPEDDWGIAAADVPGAALETAPGDVILFNHNLMHASFGGGPRRGMIKINFARPARAAAPPALDPSLMAEIARWLQAADRAAAGAQPPAVPACARQRLQDAEVVVNLSDIMQKLLTRQVVASDMYALADPGELEFVGRVLFSPFPMLLSARTGPVDRVGGR